MKFGYNESVSLGSIITNIDCTKLLKHNVCTTMNLQSITPNNRTAISQIKSEDNISKTHEGEINR
jgi:hypothetical protein